MQLTQANEEGVMGEPLEPVFAELRERMLRSSSGMNASTDEPGNMVLKTPWSEPGKKEPAWFGAVQLRRIMYAATSCRYTRSRCYARE
jgi:hypothetical protein